MLSVNRVSIIASAPHVSNRTSAAGKPIAHKKTALKQSKLAKRGPDCGGGCGGRCEEPREKPCESGFGDCIGIIGADICDLKRILRLKEVSRVLKFNEFKCTAEIFD